MFSPAYLTRPSRISSPISEGQSGQSGQSGEDLTREKISANCKPGEGQSVVTPGTSGSQPPQRPGTLSTGVTFLFSMTPVTFLSPVTTIPSQTLITNAPSYFLLSLARNPNVEATLVKGVGRREYAATWCFPDGKVAGRIHFRYKY